MKNPTRTDKHYNMYTTILNRTSIYTIGIMTRVWHYNTGVVLDGNSLR